MAESLDFSSFPSTRYQGSKRKILPWIYDTVKDLEFKTVLDACGGSGSVSYLFKKMGKQVTYNDKLKFNSLIGKAIIENQRFQLLDEDVNNLLNNDLLSPEFITNNFKNVYFLPSENRWLDKMSNGILNMNHYHGNELAFKKSLAYYALFQASLIKRPFNLFHRKNLYLRTQDVERNFGNKTTWDKSFLKHFKEFIVEVNSLVFDSKTKCRATNQSILEIDPNGYDLVYIDPPYLNQTGSNESSNYLRCYHFLEGIANYDRWEDLVDEETINLRFKDDQNDFNEENIYRTFETIIERFSNSTIVMSYKKGGTPSIDFLVNTMKKYKANVYTKSQHYKYALNKQNGDAKKNREVLIIGI